MFRTLPYELGEPSEPTRIRPAQLTFSAEPPSSIDCPGLLAVYKRECFRPILHCLRRVLANWPTVSGLEFREKQDIQSPPVFDHMPLHGPLYGDVYREGRVEPLFFSLSLSKFWAQLGVPNFGFWFSGSGFRVEGSEFEGYGCVRGVSGFGVQNCGLRLWG